MEKSGNGIGIAPYMDAAPARRSGVGGGTRPRCNGDGAVPFASPATDCGQKKTPAEAGVPRAECAGLPVEVVLRVLPRGRVRPVALDGLDDLAERPRLRIFGARALALALALLRRELCAKDVGRPAQLTDGQGALDRPAVQGQHEREAPIVGDHVLAQTLLNVQASFEVCVLQLAEADERQDKLLRDLQRGASGDGGHGGPPGRVGVLGVPTTATSVTGLNGIVGLREWYRVMPPPPYSIRGPGAFGAGGWGHAAPVQW